MTEPALDTSLRLEPAEERRVSVLSWVLVLGFIGESLLAKSHVPTLSFSTPVHVALTAVLGGAIVVAGVGRRRVPLPFPIRLLFFLLFGLAVVSSVYSERFVTFNVVFALVWVVHFTAVWWGVPGLLGGARFSARADLGFWVFTFVILTSLVFYTESRHDRAEGFFDSATHLARLSALAVVCAFSEWLVAARHRRPWMLLIVPALALLALSRTRASIGAALVGCLAVLLSHTLARERVYRTRAAVVTAAVFLFLITAFFLVDLEVVDTDNVLDFLRLRGGVSEVLGPRMRIWASGFDRLDEVGLLGEGFSAKFAGPTATKWGVEYPTYDWREIVDPHNMLVTTALQNGLVAMVLLGLLVGGIGVAVLRLDPRPRAMALGVLTSGLVFGLFDGNWFIAFSPVDRISMIILALMLACPGEPEDDVRPGATGPPGRRPAHDEHADRGA